MSKSITKVLMTATEKLVLAGVGVGGAILGAGAGYLIRGYKDKPTNTTPNPGSAAPKPAGK